MISARDGAEVWEATLDGGLVVETELHSRRLEDSRQPINDMRSEILGLRERDHVREHLLHREGRSYFDPNTYLLVAGVGEAVGHSGLDLQDLSRPRLDVA